MRHGVAADISVASEEGRLFVSTPVEDAGEDDGSLLASMGILFFGTMRQDVLPCCLARYERYLIWRYPDDVSILVVQLSYILFGSATQHVTDVWQSSDSIDLGTGDAAEWIVV